ncbi:hypothetical protein [Streptomyces sp. NPDC047928]|uniref:hypothetical protein n=1 Tax=unclassified Streptomyces TaxID=2593676 RepID=UPI00371C5032
MAYTIDRPQLVQQIRQCARNHAGANAAVRTLATLYGASPSQRTVHRLIERMMLRVLGVHVDRLTATRNRMERALNRLLDDLDALQAEGPRTVRDASAQAQDLKALVDALDELKTFRDDLLYILRTDEHGLRTMARNELEALRGRPRSYAPVESAGRPPAGPPRPAAGTGTEVAGAAVRLFEAIEAFPPYPVRPERVGGRPSAPYKPLTARQYGRQSRKVTRAARRYVAMFEQGAQDPVAAAVKSVLAGQDSLADRNRMAIAILVSQKRIWPGRRVPTSGPHVKAGAYQEKVTGSSFEWTGKLQQPVRTFTTIGIDGIVDGFVYDAKHTDVALSRSGHLKGQVMPGPVRKESLPQAPGSGEAAPEAARAGVAGKAPQRRLPEKKAPEPKQPAEPKAAQKKPTEPKPTEKKPAEKKDRPAYESDEVQGGLPRRDADWQRDTTPDLTTEMRPPEPLTARELIAVYEEKTGISVTGEMERQLVFAQENGLRGVVWVTNSEELGDAFRHVFHSEVKIPKGPDVTMEIRVEK